MVKYIIRLDDASLNMDLEKWIKIENILDKFILPAIVGVIPDNKDPSFKYNFLKNEEFWSIVKKWENKNWLIAMHGYQHLYVTSSSGIFNIHNRSEFAGLSYDEQKNKIIKAYSIFLNNQIKPKVWMAPSHTFDEITLQVLREYTDIRIVTDGFFRFPCKYNNDFLFIPQQIWKFKKPFLSGVYTICLHPNEMKDEDFRKMEIFIEKNKKYFIDDFKQIESYNNFCKKDSFFYYNYFLFKLKQGILNELKKVKR